MTATIEAPPGRFGVVHEPALHEARGRFAARLDRLRDAGIGIDAAAADRSCGPLAAALDEVAIRALITDFRTRAMDYGAYEAWIATDAGRAELLDRYPELGRLLDLVCRQWLANADLVLSRLATDRPWGFPARHQQLVAVRLGCGDRHRGGGSVAIVEFSDGARLVHKPQPGDVHEWIDTVRSAVDPAGTLLGPLLAEHIARPDYVWQRFVEPQSARTPAEVRRYFQLFGGVLALTHFMGATDLHQENVVATAAGPILIDTETLTSTFPTTPPDASAHAALGRDLERSPLHTMLLPMRFAGSPFGIDISGIGVPESGPGPQSFQVTGAGTDDIGFGLSETHREPLANGLRLGGQWVDPRLHKDAIASGFELVSHRLNPDTATLVLESLPSAVRLVVRPTYVYARFIEASTHPAYLGSAEARRRLLERLPLPGRLVSGEARALIRAVEVDAMMQLDVPQFELLRDRRALRAGASVEVPLDEGRTLREEVSQWLAQDRAGRRTRDLAYLEASLATAARDAWSPDAPDVALPGLETRRAALIDRPDHPLVVWTADRTQATWLSATLVEDDLRMSPLNLTLYEGGGELIQLADRDDAPADLVRAAASAAVVHSVSPESSVVVLSPFVGAVADAVVLRELRHRGLIVPDAPRASGTELLRHLESFEPASADYLTGLGGFVAALLRYPGLIDALPPADRLAAAASRLLPALSEPGDDLGLAHGLAGRLLLVAGLARLTADRLLADAARDMRADLASLWPGDRLLHDPRNRWSWCRGLAGITHALALGSEWLGDAATEGTRWVSQPLEELGSAADDPEPDYSVCHGVAGRVVVMDWIGRTWGIGSASAAARRTVDAYERRYAAGGGRSGLRATPELTTYMLGFSGWEHVRRVVLGGSNARLPLLLTGGPA